jgi:hypothetical protein
MQPQPMRNWKDTIGCPSGDAKWRCLAGPAACRLQPTVSRTRSFDALGLAFDVEAADPRLTTHVEHLYAGFPDPGPASHRYRLQDDPSDDGRGELWFDDERLGAGDAPEALVATLVHDLNRQALGGSEHLILHAGGVEHGGIGVALPGAMEAGKTTLVAGLVRAGLGYLSDEAVAVDRQSLRIHPYPKPLSVDRGAWFLFPELEPHVDLPTDTYKKDQWQVAPRDIRPDPLGQPCSVAVIVFPRYEEGLATSIQPLGRAEALVELAKNTYKFDVQGAPALDVLADVVRPADCYRLAGGDLDAAVAAVIDLLDP